MFNNCNFVFRPKFTDPIGHKCLSTNHLYFKLYLPMFPMNQYCFLFLLLQFFDQSVVFIQLQETPMHQYWLLPLLYYSIICHSLIIYFCYVVMLNSIQNPIRILQKNFLFATGTLTAQLHTTKLVLPKAYNSIYKFDVICLSEINLDASILHNDSNLKIAVCNLVHSDHPSNKKRGGVCIRVICL